MKGCATLSTDVMNGLISFTWPVSPGSRPWLAAYCMSCNMLGQCGNRATDQMLAHASKCFTQTYIQLIWCFQYNFFIKVISIFVSYFFAHNIISHDSIIWKSLINVYWRAVLVLKLNNSFWVLFKGLRQWMETWLPVDDSSCAWVIKRRSPTDITMKASSC